METVFFGVYQNKYEAVIEQLVPRDLVDSLIKEYANRKNIEIYVDSEKIVLE